MTRNACLSRAWSKGNATFNYLLRGDSSDRRNATQQSTPTALPYFLSPSFTLASQSAQQRREVMILSALSSVNTHPNS